MRMMCLNEGEGKEDGEEDDGVEGFDVGEADGEAERSGGVGADGTGAPASVLVAVGAGDGAGGAALGMVCGGNDVGDGCSSAIV